MSAARSPRTCEGYALVALLAACAIMLILMTAALPTWRYLIQNDKEEELLFRGGEIADAIARYQQRHGTMPTSLEVLVKGRFLRRAYKDPMTKAGNWRLIRPGEMVGALSPNPFPSRPGGATVTTTTTTTLRPSAFSQPTVIGPFQGVASTSTEKSLRIFNGRRRYDEWVFLPGQPRVIGKPKMLPGGLPGAVRPPMPGGPPNPPGLPGMPQPGMPPGTGSEYVIPP